MTQAPKTNKAKLRREQKEAEKNSKKSNVVVQKVKVLPADKDDVERAIKLQPYLALGNFANGIASPTDWRTLQFRTIVGLEILKAILAGYQVADEDAANVEEVRDQATLAVEMVGAIAVHYNETGRLRASPAKIDMIEAGLWIADDLQDFLSPGELLVAYRHAEMLINSKNKAHNQQRGKKK